MTTNTHSGGHEHGLSLDAALAFLNTLELESGRLVDHLHEPADAGLWFVDQGVLDPGETDAWGSADLARIRTTRGALRVVVDAVFEARPPDTRSVDTVNRAIGPAVGLRLEVEDGLVRVGHAHLGSSVDVALAALAAPIVEELASGRPDRFRICANDRCRWSFYDASPTGRRRWCDMRTCGNRAKAARHRERARSGVEDPA